MTTVDSQSQLANKLYQACLVEVLSRKPGNVMPGNEFTDATVNDFVVSAKVSAPILAAVAKIGVGRAIFEAVDATNKAVGHNTNLGILLLLAPLAAVPESQSLAEGISPVLSGLTTGDADWSYKAIRLAGPGGLGDAEAEDVQEAPTQSLQECMRLAADRDLIAAQYSNNYEEVLGVGATWLIESATVVAESDRMTWLALMLLSHFGDSLIARKCGQPTSDDVKNRAQAVLEAGWPHRDSGRQAYVQFDDYLRSDGNRLNPGTTADMIAAIVFCGLRSGTYVAKAYP